MNIKWGIISASLAASLLLAACGTSDADDNGKTDANDEAPVEEPAAEPETDIEEDTDAAVDKDAAADSTEQDDLLKDAVETKSDEQDYSIMVIPGYSLTSEEPGRDSLYSDEDSATFMRIETSEKGGEAFSFDEWYENMEELLKASSDGTDITELTEEADLPKGEGFLSVKGAKAESGEGYFEGYVMEREDKLVRVTIYAEENNEQIEKFRKMASTIK
ncbi:hypothetical protein [Sporosarcina cascadiensis]|uniref:hypothetical protein n=1 Tax=Sporosarcina cascadiensis TaxID=2660747 RepID=UPI00129A3C07|nr:hypothetical protein [Sporosarcina cascadiensis]